MRLDTIFGILLTLVTKEKCTAKYIAEKYNISTRTVYRYIDIISTNNIPVYTKSGKNGGIVLANKLSLTSSFFTIQERMSLITLSQHITDNNIRLSIQTKLLAMK